MCPADAERGWGAIFIIIRMQIHPSESNYVSIVKIVNPIIVRISRLSTLLKRLHLLLDNKVK